MEEQKTEDRYFHIENVGKNIITTVIGCVLMVIGMIALIMVWFFDLETIPLWQVCVVEAVGFLLLFARDKVTSYLDIFIRKKIDK